MFRDILTAFAILIPYTIGIYWVGYRDGKAQR